MQVDSIVKIMKCRLCDNHTNALALHKKLKPIREEVFDPEPCDRCKKLFDTHKYFIGDSCRHSGFIKTEALKRILSDKSFAQIETSKTFHMEKCFACLGLIKLEDCPRL